MKQQQKNLDEIMMSDWPDQTAAAYLETIPEQYRELATEAIYKCLKRGWELNPMTIQSTAREIVRERNPNDY